MAFLWAADGGASGARLTGIWLDLDLVYP